MILQEVDPEVKINAVGYNTTEIENINTKYNEIDTSTLTVIPFIPQNSPTEGEPMHFKINGETVFRGFIGDVKDKGGHIYEVTAFNNIHNLKVNNININIDEKMPVSKILENHIFPQADVSAYNVDIDPPTAEERLHGVIFEGPTDNMITMDRNNTPAAQIVDELAKLANAVWWVDSHNTVFFGPARTKLHQLEHIVDTSAGKTTPPYRSVKVVGDNVVSKGGWQDRNMVSKEPTTSVCAIDTGETIDWKMRTGELREPTFVYKSKDIKTQKQADAIAKHVTQKLVQQTKSGWVECTGRPNVEVYDVIEMPYHFGGEKYMVSGTEHMISNDNGFTTKIHVGGLISTT